MSKPIVADIDETLLCFSSEHSDRFVYSNYFIPFLVTFGDDKTPILPFYAKQRLIEITQQGIISRDRVITILRKLGYDELWDKNADGGRALSQNCRPWRKPAKQIDINQHHRPGCSRNTNSIKTCVRRPQWMRRQHHGQISLPSKMLSSLPAYCNPTSVSHFLIARVYDLLGWRSVSTFMPWD